MSFGRNNGFLIAIEGIDGSGKTTQARLLGESLTERGVEVVVTKEPTNGQYGSRIRESSRSGRLAPRDEFALFLEDRREHVSDLLRPSLEAGKVVIVDRYYYSSVAYQGARGIGIDEILEANEAFAPPPDLLFLLEIPISAALSRIATRDGKPNLFENGEYLQSCAEVFESLEESFIVRLDGTRSVDALHSEIRERVVKSLEQKVDKGDTQSHPRSSTKGKLPAGDSSRSGLRFS